MSKIGAPIFIMSSERSGSNLLRVLLGNHSNIASPVTAQLLTTVSPFSKYYTPFSEKENAEALFNEITRVVNHEYHAWKFDVGFNAFLEFGKQNTFLDFFDFFYSHMIKKKKPNARIVFKENGIFNYAFELLSYYPDAKFIYLYRDPRDYVASWMNVPLGYESPEKAISVWVNEQRKCDLVTNVFGLKAHRVKYEDLVENTPKVLMGILDFIGEPVEEACFSTDTNKNKEVTWNTYWKNLDKPVMKDNTGKFLKLFDETTIRLLENKAKEYMIKLDYKPIYDYKLLPVNNSLIDKIFKKMKSPQQFKQSSLNDQTSKLLKERHSISKEIQLNAQRYFNAKHTSK